jgi:hypothetical protein
MGTSVSLYFSLDGDSLSLVMASSPSTALATFFSLVMVTTLSPTFPTSLPLKIVTSLSLVMDPGPGYTSLPFWPSLPLFPYWPTIFTSLPLYPSNSYLFFCLPCSCPGNRPLVLALPYNIFISQMLI